MDKAHNTISKDKLNCEKFSPTGKNEIERKFQKLKLLIISKASTVEVSIRDPEAYTDCLSYTVLIIRYYFTSVTDLESFRQGTPTGLFSGSRKPELPGQKN